MLFFRSLCPPSQKHLSYKCAVYLIKATVSEIGVNISLSVIAGFTL